MASFLYIQEGTEKVTVSGIILPVSGMHTGDQRQAFTRPFSCPDTHCQEETCFENVLWEIVPKIIVPRTSLVSAYASGSFDSTDFYLPSNFSERNRTFAPIDGWRHADHILTSKAAM